MSEKMVRLIALLVLFVAAVSIVQGKSPEEAQTEAISDITCDVSKKNNKQFFKCISGCQAMFPYFLKGKKEPNFETRKELYKIGDLNPVTQLKSCGEMAKYAQMLKKLVLKHKGGIKPLAATLDGMETFFGSKIGCFEACGAGDYGAATAAASTGGTLGVLG